jgi:hypothetical protein
MRQHQSRSDHTRGERNEKLQTETYIERYKRIKTEIPERYHDIYESLTGSGRSPSVFQATVCYIESEVSQSGAADIFDCTEVAIRDMVRDIIDAGVVTIEEVRENNDDRWQRFGEKRVDGENWYDGGFENHPEGSWS